RWSSRSRSCSGRSDSAYPGVNSRVAWAAISATARRAPGRSIPAIPSSSEFTWTSVGLGDGASSRDAFSECVLDWLWNACNRDSQDLRECGWNVEDRVLWRRGCVEKGSLWRGGVGVEGVFVAPDM